VGGDVVFLAANEQSNDVKGGVKEVFKSTWRAHAVHFSERQTDEKTGEMIAGNNRYIHLKRGT